jgi:NTP pyrophosphatase (non-canonical NTP hydrolase)
MALSVDQFAEHVKAVADRLFPERTDQSMFLKLYEEVAEVIASDSEHDELADLFILLMDHAKRKNMDIENSVKAKLAILETRVWEMTPQGTFHHVDFK